MTHTSHAQDRTDTLVLELARPADWALLGAVWRGIQAELSLPAPAIAVNGQDGYQLWMRLAEPVPTEQALRFLQGLRQRFLPPDLAPGRLRTWPARTAQQPPRLPPHELHERPPAAREDDSARWAAFIAPDLAPVFEDSPWLDIPPNPEGQADLLARRPAISKAAFDAACEQLAAQTRSSEPPLHDTAPHQTADAAATITDARHPAPLTDTACLDPREFLLRVMNDSGLPMQQRIEAARALWGQGAP